MSMGRQQMERCLQSVAAFRASGQTAKVWAEANNVPMRAIASWCAHSRRWQARLEGVGTGPLAAPRPRGFVAARMAANVASTSVRVELNAGGAKLDLHWPLAHTRELAEMLRELSR